MGKIGSMFNKAGGADGALVNVKDVKIGSVI